MKNDLFRSCGHCWVFQISWHFEGSTFTASSFRIWNRSTGILSSSLALFVEMLPKAHLTLHSRVLALGEWSHHCSYQGHEDLFLYSSSVYSCHIFLISSVSVRSIPFMSFIVLIFEVVLEKTLESPLDCKEIQPVHPKRNQSWVFIERTDVEAKAPILWPPDEKGWLIWKDPDARKRLKVGEEGDSRGWDGWMASPTQ